MNSKPFPCRECGGRILLIRDAMTNADVPVDAKTRDVFVAPSFIAPNLPDGTICGLRMRAHIPHSAQCRRRQGRE